MTKRRNFVRNFHHHHEQLLATTGHKPPPSDATAVGFGPFIFRTFPERQRCHPPTGQQFTNKKADLKVA